MMKGSSRLQTCQLQHIKKISVDLFLMVNFVSRFIPKMSELSAPLHQLLHDDAIFTWDSNQKESFTKLKSALFSAPVLAYYDRSIELILQINASSTGVEQPSCKMIVQSPLHLRHRHKPSYSIHMNLW